MARKKGAGGDIYLEAKVFLQRRLRGYIYIRKISIIDTSAANSHELASVPAVRLPSPKHTQFVIGVRCTVGIITSSSIRMIFFQQLDARHCGKYQFSIIAAYASTVVRGAGSNAACCCCKAVARWEGMWLLGPLVMCVQPEGSVIWVRFDWGGPFLRGVIMGYGSGVSGGEDASFLRCMVRFRRLWVERFCFLLFHASIQ